MQCRSGARGGLELGGDGGVEAEAGLVPGGSFGECFVGESEEGLGEDAGAEGGGYEEIGAGVEFGDDVEALVISV